MFAFPGTYKFEKVARGPVKFIVDETFKNCVLMYGIVNVSKKNVAFAMFAVIEPLTLKVSVTITFVRLEVPYTFRVFIFADVANMFVVVTELETTRFANGWVMASLDMLDNNPPSP